MSKTYTGSITLRGARPRSRRLRETGSAVQQSMAAAVSVDGHSHGNFADLERLGISDQYVTVIVQEEAGGGTTQEVRKRCKSGFADEAQKLATVRTLWGRAFDGSGNVQGDMAYVGSIDFAAKATPSVTGNVLEVVTVNGVPALHTTMPFYSDQAITAFGQGTGGGSGGGVSLQSVWQSLQGNTDSYASVQIHESHLAAYLKSATAASTYVPQTRSIAGLAMTSNITASALKTALALNHVANKTVSEILGSMTSAHVTAALGFTPAQASHSHTVSDITDVESWISGKGYLTSAAAAAAYLPLSGGTMSGSISGCTGITSSGNVNIGSTDTLTLSPSSICFMSTSLGEYKGILYEDQGGLELGSIGLYNGGAHIQSHYVIGTPSQTLVKIMAADGKVGIGVNKTPSYQLDVDGVTCTKGLRITNGYQTVAITVDSDGKLQVAGDMYATGAITALTAL